MIVLSLIGLVIAISNASSRSPRPNTLVVHRTVNAYVVLASAHEAELKSFDRTVSTPGSLQYGHFLSTKEFAKKFGASRSTLRAVESYFRKFHMAYRGPWNDHLVLEVRGTINDAQEALRVTFHESKVGDLGEYPEADQLPSFPPWIANHIVAVVGIFPNGTIPAIRHPITEHRTYSLVRRVSSKGNVRSKNEAPSQNLTPKNLPTASCATAKVQASQQGAYLPSAIAQLYGMDPFYRRGDFGKGVVAAFPEFTQPTSPNTSFTPSLEKYFSCFSIPRNAISYDEVSGGSGNHSINNLEEVSLDVENFLSLAPKAKVIVYSSTQANSDLMFMKMVSQNRAGLIVSSWGSCEDNTYAADLQAENLAFLEAAAQGQSVMSAAGDDGSADCWSSGHNTSLSVDDPASQPWVTGVGGVQYQGNLETAAPSVWNDPNYSGGSGGGVSAIWPMPSYQQPIYRNDPEAVNNCSNPHGCRLVPDVSTLGEGFLVHTPAYGWDVIGGTSGSTPIFASGIALMESIDMHRLGFLNPLLYDLYQRDKKTFVDVTRGNNDYHHVNGGLFHAMVGYDVTSGLGTPIFYRIYNDMKAISTTP